MSQEHQRKSFILHTDSLEILDDLTDEQAGKLFKAIKQYQNGNDAKLPQLIKIAFSPFKNYFDRDNKKWELEIEKRREAGRLGAEARWGKSEDANRSQEVARGSKRSQVMASAIGANSKMANMADSVSVSVNESVNVNDIVITLPLNDNTDYEILKSSVDEYIELYQAVDVLQELRKMKGWLVANPTKRKTSRGVSRFIVNWLAREQDKGGSQKDAPTSYAEIGRLVGKQSNQEEPMTIDEIKQLRQDDYDVSRRALDVHTRK